MKRKGILTLTALCLATVISLAGCGGKDSLTKDATLLPYSTGVNADGKYDETLFYRNDLFTKDAPDPGSIYCEEDGYWYIFTTGLACIRTKDFVTYEDMGIALDPDPEAWSYTRYWAPECIYDKETQKYYLYYSAAAKDVPELNMYDSLRLGVAVSDTPAGPYHEWEGERTLPKRDENGNRIQSNGQDVMITETVTKRQFPFDFMNAPIVHQMGLDNFACIDVSPFYDDNGDLYLFFDRHIDRNVSQNCIWGVKMLDAVTPDYDTLKQLTQPGRKTPGGEENFEVDNNINEGPFMISHTTKKPDGSEVKKYYLTYSNYGYSDRGYSVACAVADDPLGDFVKLDQKYGQPLHGIDADFDHTAGTAHHQFIKYGDEWFIQYHAFSNRETVANGRSVAFDRIVFTYNEELGFDLIHSNGPTYSLQPLPYVLTGYRNLATEATVTADSIASGSSATLLNDGRVSIKESNACDFLSAGNSVTITLDFGKEVTVRALMIYNGYDIMHAFSQVDVVRFDSEEGGYYLENLVFPEEYVSVRRMRPGGAAVAEFNEIKANKITLKITKKIATEKFSDQPDQTGISISDIVVIGK